MMMSIDRIHVRIFQGLMLLLAVMAALVLIRQLGGYWVGHVHKLAMPAVTFACAAHLAALMLIDPHRLRIQPVVLVLGAMLLFAGLQGAFALALGLHGYGLRQYVPHVFSACAGLIIFLSFSNRQSNFDPFLRIAERIAPWILAGFAVAISLVYLVYLPRGNFYLGFSSDALLLPLALAIRGRRAVLGLLTLALILLSGKRGVLLALPVLLAVEVYFMRFSRRRLIALAVASLSVAALTVAVTMIAVRLGIAPGFLDKILLLVSALANFKDPAAMALATSGRSIELAAAVAALSSAGAWFSGLGYGFGFYVPNVTGDWIQYQHYVHVTPFNYVLQNGAIFALILYGAILWMFATALRRARDSGDPAERFLLMLTAGYLMISITAYLSGSDSLYLVLLGLVGAIASRVEPNSRRREPPSNAQVSEPPPIDRP